MKSGLALNSNHYLLHFRHFGTPEKNDLGPLWGSQIDAKIGSRNQHPKKLPNASPKVTKKRCQRALRGYLKSPKMLVVASNPLHKRCLAASLLRKRWRQGGGSTTCPRLGHDLATTCRRLAHENIRCPNFPPGPSLETAKQDPGKTPQQEWRRRESMKGR